MISDHDAAGDLAGFDCEEDPVRFEREVWVVWEKSSERANSISLSSCPRPSDCEKAGGCWVGVSEKSSMSTSTTSLGGWDGLDLVSDWFDGAAKNDESIVCPDLVPNFCFFVDRVVVEDECLDVWGVERDGDSFRFVGRACWDSGAGGDDGLVTCEEEGGGSSSISGSESIAGVEGVFTVKSGC